MGLVTLFDKIGYNFEQTTPKRPDFSFSPTVGTAVIDRNPYVVSDRLVICGSFVEHYHYKSPYVKGLPAPLPVCRGRFSVRVPQKEITEANVRRTRSRIRRLVNSNPDLNKFLTLTFKDDIAGNRDFLTANQYFDVFVKRMRRFFSAFKYVCVPEYQSDYYFRSKALKPGGGAIHYHLLCNLPYIDISLFEGRFWTFGFARLNCIDNVDNVGAYVCKYLGKANFDVRFFKKKKFFYSTNLIQPLVVDKFDEFKNWFSFLDLKSCIKRFFTTIDTDFFGVIEYSQYKINIKSDFNFLLKVVPCTS
jgi:hypothetical protein